jgi:riboflavin synthase
MFTGLIETTGTLKEVRRAEKSMLLEILPAMIDFEVAIGASVCINGVCLTLESVVGKSLFFTAVQETLYRTAFKNARCGDMVNLERALKASGRFDGHIVLGHVDGVGLIVSDRIEGNSVVRSIVVPQALGSLLAEKGSVALDGISLTIAKVENDTIEISFIPHTLKSTTMHKKKAGDAMNIECDVLARYVARMISYPLEHPRSADSPAILSQGSLLDTLERSGF